MPDRNSNKNDNPGSGQMFDKSEDEHYKDIVRFPLKLFVTDIELSPTPLFEIVRTSYDLELSPPEIRKLHEWLGKKLEEQPFTVARIRIIGRLV